MNVWHNVADDMTEVSEPLTFTGNTYWYRRPDGSLVELVEKAAARDRPGLDETAEFWHRALKDDPLLPDCSGTHMMGYAYCQRLAIAAEAQQREGAGE